jgi:hypothetical protein
MNKWANSVFVRNDTLFLNALDNYHDGYGRSFIQVFAPNIESVTLVKSSLTISSLHQKSLKVNLSDWSHFKLGHKISGLDSFKIFMSGKSEIGPKDYSDNKSTLKIQTVEAELQDSCTLNLARADIENFKLKASEGNKIELSSNTLTRLMKNN